jgi:hypothetical protein
MIMTAEEAITQSVQTGSPVTVGWAEQLSNDLYFEANAGWEAHGFHESSFRGHRDGVLWIVHLIPDI